MFSDDFKEPEVQVAPPSPRVLYSKDYDFVSFLKDNKRLFEEVHSEDEYDPDYLSESSSGEEDGIPLGDEEKATMGGKERDTPRPVKRFKSLGKWEEHTNGFASKIMSMMGYVEVR